MSLDKRPHRGETTEDLIRLEQTFKAALNTNPARTKPAATAVRIGSNPTSSKSPSAPPSDSLPSCFTGLIVEKNNRSVPKKEILVERKSKFKSDRLLSQHPKPASSQVPAQISDEVKKKLKISYDFFDPFKSSEAIPISTDNQSQSSASGTDTSVIDQDTSLGAKIHPLLAGYSEADIVQARDSLLASMKPETKEILKKRREAQEPGTGKQNNKKAQPSSEEADVTLSNKFPHMDQYESEKLEWTKPIVASVDSTESVTKATERSGRFGLDGRLLTEELESKSDTWSQGLHHHGDEMERPGYTIEELLTLSRSTFPHQRTFGFNVLAEIFKRAHNGEFDLTLDSSVFQASNELDFIHVLRIGVDVRDSLSLNASINCLASLIFPEQEELCLDISLNWPNAEPFPWLVTEGEPKMDAVLSLAAMTETEGDLKDFQCVKTDLLAFLVTRTDILVRFNYLLSERIDLLTEVGVEGMLKILIRLARHSPNAILERSAMLDSIHNHYMTANWSRTGHRPTNLSGVPLALAVKLFRILASSGVENAAKLYNEFYLFPAIMSYLAFSEWADQNLVMKVEHLVLEASNLWEIFLNYGFGFQEYMSFFPVMMTSFQALYRRDIVPSFDLTYAARLHVLLEKALKVLSTYANPQGEYDTFKESVGFVNNFVVKLLSMLGRESILEKMDIDLSLLAILTGLECLIVAQQYDTFPLVDQAIKKFLETTTYSKITLCLQSHSLLLFHNEVSTEGKDRYPSNVSTSNAILFGGNQTPILNKGSPWPFMTCIVRYATATKSIHLVNSILNDHCKRYINKVGTTNQITGFNYFLRFELFCLHELLNLVSIPDRLLPLVKIFPQIQSGDELLSRKVLQMLIESTGVENTQELGSFYSKFLYISGKDKDPYTFKTTTKKVVCRNWIWEPLNILYESMSRESKGKQSASLEAALETIVWKGVKTTLEFVTFCLSHCDRLVISTLRDIPAMYTRLALVFMTENRIFLDPPIEQLLRETLRLLLTHRIWKRAKGKSLFSQYSQLEEFPATFNSFYADLLEAFGANSFGNDTFASYVALPVRLEEDVEIRSMFWNDEAIQFIRTPISEFLIPLEYFTSSTESSSDMIHIYAYALKSKRVSENNPVLYSIICRLTGVASLPACGGVDKGSYSQTFRLRS